MGDNDRARHAEVLTSQYRKVIGQGVLFSVVFPLFFWLAAQPAWSFAEANVRSLVTNRVGLKLLLRQVEPLLLLAAVSPEVSAHLAFSVARLGSAQSVALAVLE